MVFRKNPPAADAPAAGDDAEPVRAANAALQQRVTDLEAQMVALRGQVAEQVAAVRAEADGHQQKVAQREHELAEARKGAGKLVVAARSFLAATDGLSPELLGTDASGKSRLQVARNAFAEALNDMKPGA